MRRAVVFMFSGQGSQYYQMGRELYHSHARFRMWMDHCDEIALPLMERSLCDLLYRGADKSERFDRLLYTNPALLCFEFSLARVLIESGIKPDYVLGYSLGEISAAVIAGALSLEQGVRFVVDCAKVLEAESPRASMLAVLDTPSIMARYTPDSGGCWITARNFDRHFVVSGPVAAVERIRAAMLRDGIVCQLLAVNVGFHCEMLQPMERSITELARRMDCRSLRMPLVSSLDGAVLDTRFDSAQWPRHFWSVLRHPIAFDTTIQALLRRGDFHFVDVGPSGTLATFTKYLLPTGTLSVCTDVINTFGKDNRSFDNALRSLGVAEVRSA
ncbi:acyltransferase domain-containing protein [Steroidobacter sp. S1-65]|uniref:Acyltransferase domain-containing protein n=1 Tax=Steroidobacter gossypii TaxID=2805490 RepID=A0ABS1WUE3_9GAMM|nr:acyltransferase domain-containing protein [Steroidobacter gossypii]MBM0104587.1 acyltransferase domain-containing protein [Steroidobacter gossypii]